MSAFSGVACQGVFSSCRGGKRQGFSGSARQPALFSQTRFFFRRKNGFEAPVKEPKGNLSKRFPLDSFENKGAAAPLRPRGCTIGPRKDFCRAKMLCGGRDERFAARNSDCRKSIQNSKGHQARKRVLTILVSTLFYICTTNIELPGSLRGRSPSVRGGVARGTTRRFSLRNFFPAARHGDRRAAKKRSDSRWRLCRLTDMGCIAGVEKTPGRFLPEKPSGWQARKKNCIFCKT